MPGICELANESQLKLGWFPPVCHCTRFPRFPSVRPAAVPGFLPSPAATEYRHNNIGQLMDDRVKAGIAPDELLFLSNSARYYGASFLLWRASLIY